MRMSFPKRSESEFGVDAVTAPGKDILPGEGTRRRIQDVICSIMSPEPLPGKWMASAFGFCLRMVKRPMRSSFCILFAEEISLGSMLPTVLFRDETSFHCFDSANAQHALLLRCRRQFASGSWASKREREPRCIKPRSEWPLSSSNACF